MEEFIAERLLLAEERLAQIEKEEIADDAFSAYFQYEAKWLNHLFATKKLIGEEKLLTMSMAELQALNELHFGELKGANYETSYGNPAYAVAVLGEEFGAFLSAIHAELRQALTAVYECRWEEFAAAVELFLELAGTFAGTWQEEKRLPDYEEIRQIFYWYVSDYADIRSERQICERVTPIQNLSRKIVAKSDLNDLRYLYLYGKSVSESELRTAGFLNNLPEERIALMADTFTEGYRIGFEVGNKDISIKKTVGIYYNLGFERVVRKAVENFEKIGLQAVLTPDTISSMPVNRQYRYDHKDDSVLFFDKQYMKRKLETMKHAYEQHKEAAGVYGGPALIEVFGEEPFAPTPKKEALKTDDKYQKLMVEYMSAYRQIQMEYIKEEERSFTIIAFPTPDIGDAFEEIFDEVIRINTLDYNLYRQIQQTIIDTLDTAEYVEIKGMNGNLTDLRVHLHPLQNPEKETKFENCVADVNIPVGEVFTSPVLTGTNGVLHVSKVFLNELEYKDLKITLQDGLVAEYDCGNFEDAAEGKKYIKENILFHHDTLPLGEFAIGTNTTAYVAAEKYHIQAKLPILIAEKMGPHFALGDTCYSHAEEVKVYNPDGKEIIARDNEVSRLRSEDMSKAYFNCHTDITIPYHELGEVVAVRADGSRAVIIKEGRFVLPGCEELNAPFGIIHNI